MKQKQCPTTKSAFCDRSHLRIILRRSLFFYIVKKASTLILKVIMPLNKCMSIIITNCSGGKVENARGEALSDLGKATGIAERPTRYQDFSAYRTHGAAQPQCPDVSSFILTL